MRPRQPALPGASKAIRAIAAGPSLVAALCLAGALAAFLVYPAYAQSSDEASAPSNLTAAIADGGVILNWSSPVQDAASVTGYEILRRRPKEGEGALRVLVADTGSTATTYVDATANEQGTRYVYRVKALRGSEKSSRSNYARVDLPEEADETGPTPDPAPRGVTVQPSGAQAETCPGGDFNPTPTAVEVGDVPIVVTSTADEYFVLYVSHDVDGTEVELPVLVKRGEAGSTTLVENVEALPKERYRVEKYLIADPADVDGDCVDDITELGDPVGMSPVNSAPPLSFSDGAVSMPDLETYVEMSQLGDTEAHSKIVVLDPGSERPGFVFINAKTHETHQRFLDAMGIDRPSLSGFLTYNSQLVAPGGSRGAWYVWISSHITFATTERIYALMAANMPALRDDLYIYVPAYKEDEFEHEREQYEASRVDVVFWEDLSPRTPVDLLNPGVGFGRLRVMDPDDRPHPREVVIYETVPNELPRVAGVITTVRQTPLSHVNLRAAQDGVPNAYVRDLLKDTDVAALVGGFVRYEVTATEWSLRAATPREVDEHYESSRPPQAQTPQRDLSVRSIAPLSDVRFEDWDAFGVKAANVAELGRLGFPEGTVPDGFAIPFYFYDEFMKANGFHDRIEQILADPDFQSDFDVQDDMLDDLRDDIEDAESPQWIIDALTEMHESFPEGTSLRYRSSTNNEDLPGFNGAGLYDSKTQDPEETEEDGIDKSLKGVFASLWNFRAFTERDFHRIGHGAAAMGVLVHPNYSDELANGVAVSFDPFYDGPGRYYVNTQLGEDLVTNPLPHSVPEELLLLPDGNYLVRSTSNLVGRGELLMSDAQIGHLAQHLTTIHDHFEALYDPGLGEPFAMEIEFKITSENILAIKQARPWVFSSAATPSPDRAGTVALSSTQPRVDTSLSATLMDPDGSISNIAWQWASSPNGSSNWATISGAASARYTPADGDVGKYLRATASYTDGHGAGKSAQAVSANTVEDASTPPPPPPPPIIGITGVTGAGGGGGGGGAPAQDPSLIVLSQTSLSFEAVQGGENPAPQTLRVWNAEEREMAFGTSENAPWLVRSPSAGITDGPDDAVRITMSVDVSGLEPGSYTASVRISGRRIGNSPQRVPVTLTVRPPGYARERVSPGERTEIVTPDSTLRLIVPENAVSAEVDIEVEKLDPASQPSPPGDQERVILAVDLQTLAPGGETPQPITFSPGAELRLLLPEDEEASCDAGRVSVYRVRSGEWELLEHRCETDEEGRVWAVSTLTSFSTLGLTVDDAAYPTGSVCWSVSNILSWTTSRTSESQASANTLFTWLQGVLRLWLSLSCR